MMGGRLAVAERRADMLVIGGLRTFHLEPELTELVNQPEEEVVSWSSLAVLSVTLTVNLAAAGVLRSKEDTAINRIIIWDCMINILTILCTTAVGPMLWLKFNSSYLCSVSMFLTTSLNAWNRLVPVGIGVFRYLLVCTE
jgi:hypothetical protein